MLSMYIFTELFARLAIMHAYMHSENGQFADHADVPIIIFMCELIDHCLRGFPDIVGFEGNNRQGEESRVTTRLFPELKFGCSGTIVRVTAAVLLDATDTGQSPKIQIWRKRETLSQPGTGLFYRMSSNILVSWSNSPCYQSSYSRGIYQCTLREDLRISVQPGDFFGLEIPPINNDNPVIYFRPGGPANLVFQRKLNSTVNLTTEPHITTYDEPQITFLVVLGMKNLM